MSASGDFVKCDFTNVMLNTTRLSNVSKMFPLCFSDMFYPQQYFSLFWGMFLGMLLINLFIFTYANFKLPLDKQL